jgi:hypothetical protein
MKMESLISRAEAQAQGLKHYFTGKPCKHGHIAERTVDGGICKSARDGSRASKREVSTKMKMISAEEHETQATNLYDQIAETLSGSSVTVAALALMKVLDDMTTLLPSPHRIELLKAAAGAVEDMIERAKSEGGVH